MQTPTSLRTFGWSRAATMRASRTKSDTVFSVMVSQVQTFTATSRFDFLA